MTIYCGIPHGADAFIKTAHQLDSPVLVSANALWNERNQRFQNFDKLAGLDVPIALDCGGFVAMARYGRYRWSIQDYVWLATEMRPAWWSAMDYCCEPEIAKNRAEVKTRVHRTAFSLAETLAAVIHHNRTLPGWKASAPTPVIQGWKPDDYIESIRLTDQVLADPLANEAGMSGPGGWPSLVGLGSVCRRQLSGPDGLFAILNRIEEHLPTHVKLHLFGVKSKAAELLRDHPRIASTDSMAWNFTARWEAFDKKMPKNQEFLASHMATWIRKQRCRLENPQLQLEI